jgi:hypothetical protein
VGFQGKQCYACAAPSTGRQHLPARCFFPDLIEGDANLITVPSCDIHNYGQKDNEEAFMAQVVASEGVNEIAVDILKGKIISEKGRKQKRWLDLMRNTEEVLLDRGGGLQPTLISTLSIDDGNRFLTLLTRGLVHKLYRAKWSPALYFCVRIMVGPNGQEAARELFRQVRFESTLRVIGKCFAFNYIELPAPQGWLSMWVYTFYDSVQYMVLCTDTPSANFLDG